MEFKQILPKHFRPLYSMLGYLNSPKKLLLKLAGSIMLASALELLTLGLLVSFLSEIGGDDTKLAQPPETITSGVTYLAKILNIENSLLIVAFLCAVAIIFREAFSYLARSYNKIGMAEIEMSIRNRLIKNMLLADLQSADGIGKGPFVEYGSLAAVDSAKLFQGTTQSLRLTVTITTYCSFLVVSFPSVVIVAGVIIILFAAVTTIIANKVAALSRKSVEEGLEFSQRAERAYSLRRVLKADSLVDDEFKQVKKHTKSIYDIAIRAEKTVSLATLVVNTSVALVLICFALVTVEYNLLEILQVTTLLLVLMRLTPLLISVSRLRALFASLIPRFSRVDNLIKHLHSSPDKIFGKDSLVESFNMLTFQNVSYSYMQNEKAVLSNVNFQIRPGECIILSGASGSGKTTLVDLMLGLRKPTKGEIYFNENKLHGFKATDYRSRVSFVGQEPVLFDGSIESNLKLRDASIKSNQIWSILEKLDLLEFVSNLKSGISTIIGERGLSLSGGQKQRFAIAGALLKEAEIIVLDEPTSALDGENEKKLIKLIKQITESGRRSAVVVTHNWSVAKYADRLLKLHLGRLVYDGAVKRHIFDNPNKVK